MRECDILPDVSATSAHRDEMIDLGIELATPVLSMRNRFAAQMTSPAVTLTKCMDRDAVMVIAVRAEFVPSISFLSFLPAFDRTESPQNIAVVCD